MITITVVIGRSEIIKDSDKGAGANLAATITLLLYEGLFLWKLQKAQ